MSWQTYDSSSLGEVWGAVRSELSPGERADARQQQLDSLGRRERSGLGLMKIHLVCSHVLHRLHANVAPGHVAPPASNIAGRRARQGAPIECETVISELCGECGG